MSGKDTWSSNNNPVKELNKNSIPPFQTPTVLPPPPSSLDKGMFPIRAAAPDELLLTRSGQHYYPLPSLPGLGSGLNNGSHFPIPSIGPQGLSQEKDSNNNGATTLPPPHLGSQQSPVLSQPQPQSQSQADSNPQPQQLPPPTALHASANQYRPLNVKDALSYLDQVKVRFLDQPDVYNHFLEIMKDFKSQSIDTPGVIERVSTLFRGHPNLIQGFNTFLPQGYKIECFVDPLNPNAIRVTTPMGTVTMTDGQSQVSLTQQPHTQLDQSPQSSSTQPKLEQDQQASRLPSQDMLEKQLHQQQEQQHHHQQQQQIPQPHNSSLPQQLQQPQSQYLSHQGPDVAYSQGNLSAEQVQNGAQVGFNHAISYVNKIKTRFANQPDIYKSFLEILQTYQKEQKPINEVYQQVTVLFQNAPDLLDDFEQFLPETSGQSLNVHQGGYEEKHNGHGTIQLPPVGNFPPPSYGQNGNVINEAPGGKRRSISHGMHRIPSLGAAHFQGQPVGMPHDQQQQLAQIGQTQEYPVSDLRGPVNTGPASLLMGVPQPVSTGISDSNLSEEISFFDKVKKSISNKQTYNEFLKLINLYSQDIIDKDVLVAKVECFIGAFPELFSWFKTFVGYEEKSLHIENITFKKHQLELSLCKSCGPSYRLLPKAETYMPCSGRDDMCWEVLNDEWVGHPTWASEESGFVAHRKNQYEEVLFRIEEERHEYDYYMEANLRTIQTLETIANRIANMTPEEKAHFKLPPGLGHTSSTIYKKVIRKIYDKDRGFEVIDALHENPAVAVPIILKRLKQKDEEWKRSHREWNKVWREMEQKVFYKSLDHLGLTFKQSDKKLLTTKQLVAEVSTIKVEQSQKRLHPLTPVSKEQLQYHYKDYDVMFDIINLVYIFLGHSSSYSQQDKKKLAEFVKFFVTTFFMLPNEQVDDALQRRKTKEADAEAENGDSNSASLADDEGNLSSASTESSFSSKKRPRNDGDLLRDVLKKNKKVVREATPDSTTASPTPETYSTQADVEEKLAKPTEDWINVSGHLGEPIFDQTKERTVYNMFCNTTIYVLYRYLNVLYERLVEVKAMTKDVDADIKGRNEVQFAKELDLLSHQLEDMGINITGDNSYLQVLELSKKLIEGDVEHQWFEESLRQAYRNKAYKLFSIDKVIQGLTKHMHSVVSDAKNSEMITLMAADRENSNTTARSQILYRIQVRSLMSPEDNMFKISFDKSQDRTQITFIALEDLTLGDLKSERDKWNYYMTSYILSQPTESVPKSKINIPFLRSAIAAEDDEKSSDIQGIANSNLKVKLDLNTYKLFFEEGSYDYFVKSSALKPQPASKKDNQEKLQHLQSLLKSGDKSAKLLETLAKGPDEYKAFVSQLSTSEVSNTTQGGSKGDALKHSEITVDAESTIGQDDSLQEDVFKTAVDISVDQDKTVDQSTLSEAKADNDTIPNEEEQDTQMEEGKVSR
ncbi:Component of the Sin3p-Rpd3p histone deacetylase complex [Komagataella phaffii GS115]|uniref:Component of the Sin3p-Rpd3p histone deacetylase complex n=1 Tax=Komagataella phaffii (strain GS115 / ATCC 20864) TaxID=644223 RepID=C4R3Z6_KOMPG|nr:Component of the Sin3p-Rpd3p histone deacetylase complex [Komagataella phaffii GS115]CAY70276.1 Component of the Sin3p-Rpd3p histone deacetylase complex [Komagataella phaffii GS115]